MYNLVNTLNSLTFATLKNQGVLMNNKALGSLVKQLRENNNLSQYQLGKITNISRSTLSMIEVGTRIPTEEQLLMLTRTLKFDLVTFSKNTTTYKTIEHYIIATELISAINEHSVKKIINIYEKNMMLIEFNYGSPMILKKYCEIIIIVYEKKDISLAYKSTIEFLNIDINNLHKFKIPFNMPNYYYSLLVIVLYCLNFQKKYNEVLTLELIIIDFLESSYFNDDFPFLQIDTFYNKYYIVALNNLADTYFTLNQYKNALYNCNKGIKFSNKLNILSILPMLLIIKVEIQYNLNLISEAKETFIDFKSLCHITDNFNYFETYKKDFEIKYPLLF